MAKIDELIEYLRGTCASESEAVPRIYGDEYGSLTDLPMRDLRELDDALFCCPGCNWWCATDEAVDDDGEDVCRDCAPTQGDDDD